MLPANTNKVYSLQLSYCLITCFVVCQLAKGAQARTIRSDIFYEEYSATTEPFTDDDDPETIPGLFEGDIKLISKADVSLRLGVNPNKYPGSLWRKGVIPYTISEAYTTEERKLIDNALLALDSATCINYVKYNGTQRDYIIISPPVKDGRIGCYSYVGRIGGPQEVTLSQRDKRQMGCFTSLGRVMHELMHAIGLYHEQSRSDRDRYVQIHWKNIRENFIGDFATYSIQDAKHSYSYDYDSVMHYGEYYFSKQFNAAPTITPYEEGAIIGQRKSFSKADCLKINDLYGCLWGKYKRMYKSLCYRIGL